MSKQVATIDNPIITYYHELEQNTPEWLAVRCGMITQSNLKLLITPTGKPANNKTTKKYARVLAAQREIGFIDENFSSFHTDRGHYEEPIARNIYSKNIAPMKECGFIVCDFGSFKIGGSPDGLVGDDGGGEIKCRISELHLNTIMTGVVDAEYLDQVQGSMLVSRRSWWDFIQYSNGMPLFTKRFTPDLTWRSTMMDILISFESLIQEYQIAYREGCKGLIKTERIEYVTGTYDETGIVASEG